jgi:hypothetical protein
MKYSGRTTAYAHKFDEWFADNPVLTEEEAPPAISQVTVFNAQWTDCPVEVEYEVKRLWGEMDFGNDHFYYDWDSEQNEDAEDYPIIHEYLMSKGVTKCLIHWWW